METNQIKPEKITKPIQLLGAWLLGLVLINTSFLTAASQITNPSWGAGMLLIASVVNVPLFLLSLFLLQTRFRPEMQEDTFYSKYLEKKYSGNISLETAEEEEEASEEQSTKEVVNEIVETFGDRDNNKKNAVEDILRRREIQKLEKIAQKSRSLSELKMFPDKWVELVDEWKTSPDFIQDIKELYEHKLIHGNLSDPYSLILTEKGEEVAQNLKSENRLWNQNNGRFIKNKIVGHN